MEPVQFAEKWEKRSQYAAERDSYQEHWNDLCDVLHHPHPDGKPDYKFERLVTKVGTKDKGFADVFKKGFLIAEYKRPGSDLGKALQQATLYARDLQNPPLLITSDFKWIEVNTAFTGTSPKTYRLGFDDIAENRVIHGSDLQAQAILHAALHKPEQLDPRLFRERVTTDATKQVGFVARRLSQREGREKAAHLVMRVVFALFAEDVGMLERGLVTRVLERSRLHPDRSGDYFSQLFGAMQYGGEFWGTDISHFNGGLFDSSDALQMTSDDAAYLLTAARLDWSEVEPSIFGTLFENSLDDATRSRRGAHYTSVVDIERIVDRVVMEPLWAEWDTLRHSLPKLKKHQRLEKLFAFQDRLTAVRVLDPACGSGNFLFVSLKKLLDLEHQVRVAAFMNDVGAFDMPPLVHPRQMLGIEVEPFAHELASITLWMGYFQWKRAHGGHWEIPILQKLDNIQNHDALLTPDGQGTPWPHAEFIVGNPPFLGDKVMRSQLGDEYTSTLRRVYGDRLPGQSDLVCYWPEKARAAIEQGITRRAGFVTTNSIRGGKNRTVLDRIKQTGDIFMAWPDLPWEQDGAAVRVSLFGFDDGSETMRTLNDEHVAVINADLSSHSDVQQAQPLLGNRGLSFVGGMKKGKFDIPGSLAQSWLAQPNPDGASNADVLKPWVNGMDLTRRPSGTWIIDFGTMPLQEAERYVQPLEYVRRVVKPERDKVANKLERERWWQHARTAPELRAALTRLPRVIGIPRVAKHLLPVWLSAPLVVDGQVVVIARDDEFSFGVLASMVHRTWAWTLGTSLEDRPRYTPSTCFETFPFPRPTAEQRTEIEKWAKYIVQLRDHLLGQDQKATLTSIYNAVEALRKAPDAAHPVSALATAHDRLDQAVAAAYGWEWPLPEEEVLRRLLALNLERAQAEK